MFVIFYHLEANAFTWNRLYKQIVYSFHKFLRALNMLNTSSRLLKYSLCSSVCLRTGGETDNKEAYKGINIVTLFKHL